MNGPALHLLLHAAHLVEERLRPRLAARGLQPRQGRVLDALDRLGPVAQVELAERFAVAPASMSVMLARMEAAGLVERRPRAGDARVMEVAPTRSGSTALEGVRADWAAVEAEIADLLGPRAHERLHDALLVLRDGLGGRAPHDPPDRTEPP